VIDASTAVTMAGILEDTQALGNHINDILVTTVMSLMCSAFVIVTGLQSRSVLKTFVALIGAAALWWGVMNITVFRDGAGEDIQNPAGTSGAIVRVDHPVREIR